MRTLLVLGRVSNLPTVWSNCLAAWLLAGGGSWDRFVLLCFGATLLYTGGMFLNDVVDVPFDRKHRPERPIPSGQIKARSVWIIAAGLLGSGWAVLLPFGKVPVVFATALVLAIVVYDFIHKHTRLAPLVMAGCRFLLYLVAAACAGSAYHPAVLWRALALALYIVGLSYLARGESTGGSPMRWPLVLLFVPILIAFARPIAGTTVVAWAAALLALWIAWCLNRVAPFFLLPKGVAGLLAGIVLVDWLACAGCVAPGVFLILFILALLFQRVAPAT